MVENIVSGKKYRILVDATQDAWDRISFWTKASDVYYNDGTTAEENKPVAILKRNTSYAVGYIAYEKTAPSWVMLKCASGGTTATSLPTTYSTITTPGSLITDGTAKFVVYDVRPKDTFSNSPYQIPAMSLVNSLKSELTANGNQFYFDYQDGKYGYNTSSNRSASTFTPFGSGTIEMTITLSCSYGAHARTYTEATIIGDGCNGTFTFTDTDNLHIESWTKISGSISVTHTNDTWSFKTSDGERMDTGGVGGGSSGVVKIVFATY